MLDRADCSPSKVGATMLTRPILFRPSQPASQANSHCFWQASRQVEAGMVPEQESDEHMPDAGTTDTPPEYKRSRRSGRGRRRRGRRPSAPPPESVGEPPSSSFETNAPFVQHETGLPPTASAETSDTEIIAPAESEEGRAPSSKRPIQDAIEEVNTVIDALRETLDKMEEVLEILELAERQKQGDEREIEQLQRALRNLQHPSQRHRKPS